MPQVKMLGAGGGGFKRAKSAELIRRVTMRCRWPSLNTKFTEEEISYLAELVMLADDAPDGLLEKLAAMEDKCGEIMEYHDLIAAASKPRALSK